MLRHAVVYELLDVFLHGQSVQNGVQQHPDKNTYATHIVEVLQTCRADEIVAF